MAIPTEPIGSIPRPQYLLDAMADFAAGKINKAGLDTRSDRASAETIERFEATGSPVVTDGEQTKPSFATYPLQGIDGLAPDGVVIPFADGHTRQLPRLTGGPFRYGTFAVSYLIKATSYTSRPVKQPVIAPSALSLLYPAEEIEGYPRETFLQDWPTGPRPIFGSAWTAGRRRCNWTSRRAGCHSSSTRRSVCCAVSLSSTPCWTDFPPRNGPSWACIPVRAATRARRTV